MGVERLSPVMEKVRQINPQAFDQMYRHKGKMKAVFWPRMALEAAFCLGSYYLFRKTNTDIDFRYKLHKDYPSILNYYYSAAEGLGGSTVRQDDARAWGLALPPPPHRD